MNIDLVHFMGNKKVPVILQAEAAECGVACLAMVASYHGFETDLNGLRMKMGVSLRGTNLATMMKMAADLELSGRPLRLDIPSLRALQTPCILHWNLDHFVVLEKSTTRSITIIDPAVGRRTISLAEASKSFTGVALELLPTPNFETSKVSTSLKLTSFFKGVNGLWPALFRLFMLSLTLQVFALLTPFYTQLVVDQVLISSDTQLLAVLSIGFAAFALINVAITTARSFTVMFFASHLGFEWRRRLFHHLLRLPLSFFERRHMGDVLSRFRSLESIQGLVTTTFVEVVIDGIMAITTAIVMLIYAPHLAAITFGAVALYAVAKVILYSPQRDASNDALIQSAKEESHFLESLRGILAIKAFSKEHLRESTWATKASNAVQAKFSAGAFPVWQQVSNQVIFSIENVAVVWLGALLIMDGGFTIGMLIAYLAYKSQFSSRASALVDKALDIRLVSIHLDRLSDIALSEGESLFGKSKSEIHFEGGRIDVQNIDFRYAPSEPLVLRSVSFTVAPGSCAAIFSPSGSGKTTLMKIMMSLLPPESGRVVVDGQSVFDGYAASFRKKIASVMQEDCLLSGSIVQNVSFFDPQADQAKVELCAKHAAIHDDIVRMPMGYATLIGDMGAALSGGQKQRLLLARALYSDPKILFLDEATSHVDPETEAKIHASLSKLSITRVMITHRRETLQIADQVIDMEKLQDGLKQKNLDVERGLQAA